MKLDKHPMGAGITVIPSGSLALDIALGVGGIPRRWIIEGFGLEGSGKTTVSSGHDRGGAGEGRRRRSSTRNTRSTPAR